MRFVLLFIIALLFTACENNSIEKTRELNANNPLLKHRVIEKKPKISQKEKLQKMAYDNKVELEKIKIRNLENLAKIEAQKEQKLKTLELEKAKAIEEQKTKQKLIDANSSKELAQIESQKVLKVKEKELSLYKIVAVIAFFAIIIWLIVHYLKTLAKQRHEAELKEKEYNFQAYTMELKQKHENISKMLDIISDKENDPNVKKEMAKILSHNKSSLIEHKKK